MRLWNVWYVWYVFHLSLPQHLEKVKAFGDVEGLKVNISVTMFQSDIARYPGMVLRGFVYKVLSLSLSLFPISAHPAIWAVPPSW